MTALLNFEKINFWHKTLNFTLLKILAEVLHIEHFK